MIGLNVSGISADRGKFADNLGPFILENLLCSPRKTRWRLLIIFPSAPNQPLPSSLLLQTFASFSLASYSEILLFFSPMINRQFGKGIKWNILKKSKVLLVSHKSSTCEEPLVTVGPLKRCRVPKIFQLIFCKAKVCWRTHLRVFITFSVFPEQGSFFKHLFVICRLPNRPFCTIVVSRLSSWVGSFVFIKKISYGHFNQP